jgi:hypothetical protein
VCRLFSVSDLQIQTLTTFAKAMLTKLRRGVNHVFVSIMVQSPKPVPKTVVTRMIRISLCCRLSLLSEIVRALKEVTTFQRMKL